MFDLLRTIFLVFFTYFIYFLYISNFFVIKIPGLGTRRPILLSYVARYLEISGNRAVA